MSFENIGKKLDLFINEKVKPEVQKVKESDYVEKKIKPATEKVLEKGADSLGKLAHKISKSEKQNE